MGALALKFDGAKKLHRHVEGKNVPLVPRSTIFPNFVQKSDQSANFTIKGEMQPHPADHKNNNYHEAAWRDNYSSTASHCGVLDDCRSLVLLRGPFAI